MEKLRVVNTSDSLISLLDVGNRSFDSVYTHGQSGYVSFRDGYESMDLALTGDVIMSLDRGNIKKFSDAGYLKTATLTDYATTELTIAKTIAAPGTFTVISTAGMASTGTIKIGSDIRNYTAITATTITVVGANLTADYPIGTAVTAHSFAGVFTLDTIALAAAVTLGVVDQYAIPLTTAVEIKIGDEFHTGIINAVGVINTLVPAMVAEYPVGTKVLVYV